MKEELQNLVWKAIPKEARKEIKLLWELDMLPVHPDYVPDSVAEGAAYILTDIFGHHNLASDEEPEEMLTVKRKTITEMYAANERIIRDFEDETMKDHSTVINGMLESLFGKDKCLPDPSDEKPSNGAIGTTPPSNKLDVKPTPKFKCGDKVKVQSGLFYVGEILEISKVEWDEDEYLYGFVDKDKDVSEDRLAPYIEPKFKVGDFVKVINCKYKGESCEIYDIDESDVETVYQTSLYDSGGNYVWLSESDLAPYAEPEPKFKIGDKVRVLREDYEGEITEIIAVDEEVEIAPYKLDLFDDEGGGVWMEEENLAPYTEPEPQQTEETMEEKELNLPTLLKGAIGETFYCPMWGDTKICSTAVDGYRIEPKDKMSGYLNIGFDGKADEDGQCILFPSRDLYLKYPLEASKAWKIWAEERKPKRWHPAPYGDYWFINHNLEPALCSGADPNYDWESDINHFQTEELCQQAVEAVKRSLEEFHEKNAEK